ncbi:hypothetical protein PInf_015938 [Phytophthora infestans]|nr:hypothetical protein PInf_015938 [Phytophthora infestans]
MPPGCVGVRIVPAIGALNKGQLYNVRVSAYNEVGFGKPAVAPSPQKPMVVPGPPTAVTLAVYSVSELVLLFSPPDDNGGDIVTAYEIEYSSDSNFVTLRHAVFLPYSSKELPRLRTISAICTIENAAVHDSQCPTQVALGTTSSTMLTVRWAPPSDDGGDLISGYVVQWDVAAGFDSLALAMGTTVTVGDSAQRSYTITGLSPGTIYYVRVFAKNRGGLGTPQTATPASLVPTVTFPGKPHTLTIAPTLVPGELRVSWLAPVIPYHGYPCAGTLQAPGSCPVVGGLDMAYGGLDLDRYVIQYSEKSDFSSPIETTTPSSVVSVLLTGLVSAKPYYVQVLAQNSQGRGYFCKRSNTQSLLCPDHQLLLDSTIVTGSYVYAAPL